MNFELLKKSVGIQTFETNFLRANVHLDKLQYW